MRKRMLLATLVLALLLASCGQSTASPTPTAEPMPTATAPPTATATAQQQPTATATAQQPTATEAVTADVKEENRVSRFGEYEGYAERIYDGYERFSQYVEARDGTLLAVDVYRPTLDGELVEEPLPVIWMHYRYQRAQQREDGTV